MAGVLHDLKTAVLSPTGTGDQTGIAAVPSKRIAVVSFVLVASAATVVTFKSGTAAFSGPMSLAANGGVALSAPADASWLFITAPGEAFTIDQSVDGVDGFATYYLT